MIPEPAQDNGVRGWGPARQTLRALLARQADLGLSTAAVEAMVCRMSFLCCQAGQEVVPEGGPAGVVGVVVGGVVKIICDSPSSKPITVEMVGAGGILQLDADACPSGYDVMAVAHTPALIAYLPSTAWREVACHLRVEECLRLAARTWRTLSRRLYERSALLAMSVPGRVLHQLNVLARDFGRPHPSGVCIDLPLSHADLAALVGAARANVTRAVVALRASGHLLRVPGRFVLAARVS